MAHSGQRIHMRNVPGRPDMRELTQMLPLMSQAVDLDGQRITERDYVPVKFQWDGSSSGIFRPIFPKHRHPIASCRHDWRCVNAKSAEDRLFADREFYKDVRRTSWWITAAMAYLGVRAWSLLKRWDA